MRRWFFFLTLEFFSLHHDGENWKAISFGALAYQYGLKK
jgi:hypothetical protein